MHAADFVDLLSSGAWGTSSTNRAQLGMACPGLAASLSFNRSEKRQLRCRHPGIVLGVGLWVV